MFCSRFEPLLMILNFRNAVLPSAPWRLNANVLCWISTPSGFELPALLVWREASASL